MFGDGFLPFSRGTFMIDFFAVYIGVVMILQAASVYLVKYRRQFLLHKRLQIFTSITFLVTLVLFEIEVRAFGWRHLAEPSPYYESFLFPFLAFHILCALFTLVVWLYTLIPALRQFPNPPAPSSHSPLHIFRARAAGISLALTAATGWFFFYLAFVA